jgi:hypothetical protein
MYLLNLCFSHYLAFSTFLHYFLLFQRASCLSCLINACYYIHSSSNHILLFHILSRYHFTIQDSSRSNSHYRLWFPDSALNSSQQNIARLHTTTRSLKFDPLYSSLSYNLCYSLPPRIGIQLHIRTVNYILSVTTLTRYHSCSLFTTLLCKL